MRKLHTALGLSYFLAIAGASAMVPTITSADTVTRGYVACNQSGQCWRVGRTYAYGEAAPITYHKSDWYAAHQNDPNVHWMSDPSNDRGYYQQDGTWHPDPAAHALAGGAAGAGVGAIIGCLVTLPIGCAPGAAVGAAIGGGTGAVAGAATTPSH